MLGHVSRFDGWLDWRRWMPRGCTLRTRHDNLWTMLGHSVAETEESSTHVEVRETATTWAAVLFGAFAALCALSFQGLAGLATSLFFACWAVYAAVSSEFTADRNRQELVVRRRVGPWTTTKSYPVAEIACVYVRTNSRGSGLAVRLKSGRSKGLTMSLGWGSDLERVAGALNRVLRTHRQNGGN